ncbi:hypothetical protein P1J78_23920 [Psychromarinibacter sp. C21-152]|uniref:Uncharacterized protein n=1 Tax=Psychromarinibacter sediminicola TaxID=3033385 RepID=A0AAE3NT12_9RHOB|nr:hypothetical protein [Psychromarinibacter sediminicola]MDF0603768.1 hypothetical protein [Psychromarinibacter sediminicola]
MNPTWLLRAKRWVQNPPSWGRVKLVAGVIVLCLGLFAVERIWGWPDWLTPENARPPSRVAR